MDKIILDLLKENGRVIIPDFGALIVKQKSPFTVIFNEFLQYNDGALIGAIATKNAIERDDAATKTREFTKNIQGKLDKGEEVNLEGIGVLKKSSTGKISIQEANQAKDDPKPVEKPIEKPEEVKTVEFDIEETKKPEEKSPIRKEVSGTGVKKTMPGGTPSSRVKKELPKSSSKKEIPGTTQKKPLPKAGSKKEILKKEIPKAAPAAKATATKTTTTPTSSQGTETPPITEYYSEGNERNKWNIFLWIIVIIVVNGAIIGFVLFRDELKSFFAKKENIETTIPETAPIIEETPVITEPIDAAEAIEPVIEETLEEVELQNPAQEIFAGTKYYVVAGVFKIESNADKLVVELRKEGYNAEKFAKIGHMHAVSYDVFPTKREADRLMLKIQQEVDKGAWIKIVD